MSITYITVQAASEILNLNPRTVTKYLTNGQLKGAKMGRVWRLDEKDVHKFFEEVKSQTAESIKKGIHKSKE